MIELGRYELDKIFHLVKEINHNRALVYSVIEGHHPGSVWVDCGKRPTAALVVTKANFMFLLGKREDYCEELSDHLFNHILAKQIEKEMILFVYEDGMRARLEEAFGGKGVISIHRKQFEFESAGFLTRKDWKTSLPPGFHMEKIRNEMAATLGIDPAICNFDGNEFGYCLFYGENAVSYCYSVFAGGGEAEIDVFTAEEYRNRGYAIITTSAFIEACMSRKLVPNWACWPYRVESCALAKKLGFKECADIPAFFWAESM